MIEVQSDQFGNQRRVSLGRRAHRNRTACHALICGSIFFCPLTTLLAPVLAVIAMRSIRRQRHQRGYRWAIAGLVLGLTFSMLQGVVAWQGYRMIQFVQAGPSQALEAGVAGDLEQFQAAFHGPASSSPSDTARWFLNELETRYGSFINCRPLQEGPSDFTLGTVRRSYLLQFTIGSVEAEALCLTTDPALDAWFVNKIQAVRVIDPKRGDLAYPLPQVTASAKLDS